MRIAVVGPQNTGKSTFVRDFLSAFPAYATPETTYRDFIEARGLPANRDGTEDSQRAIRDFLDEQIRTFSAPDALFDRCVLDNWVYTKAQHQAGAVSDAFLFETERVMYESLPFLDAILFIPTASGIAFVEDGVRDTNREFIDHINTLYIDLLLSLRPHIPHRFITISGSRAQRIERAQRALGI